jgi:hypothetical protein
MTFVRYIGYWKKGALIMFEKDRTRITASLLGCYHHALNTTVINVKDSEDRQ